MKKNYCRLVLLFVFTTNLNFTPVAFAQAGRTIEEKSGFITTPDGVKIHYIEAGPATKSSAILFIPGWTMPADIWEHQIAHFDKTHHVVAMDPRFSWMRPSDSMLCWTNS